MIYESATEQIKEERRPDQEVFCLAEVKALFDDKCAKVRFYGEEEASEKKYSYLYSYKSPAIGDIVLMGRTGNSWVILGKCVYDKEPGEEGSSNGDSGTATTPTEEYALKNHTHDSIVVSNASTYHVDVARVTGSGGGYYTALRKGSSGNADIGTSSYKWRNIYATNGTIQTSDKNEKNHIEPLSRKYIEFFQKLLPKRFKMNEGTSNRYHIGYIAQDVEQAMEDTGLTDLEFAGLIRSPYQEETEEGIIEVPEKGYHYGLRYEEFIALNTLMIKELLDRVEKLEGGA